jgi:hypothetical protein
VSANSQAKSEHQGAGYQGTVTCNADCQVRFGAYEGAQTPEKESAAPNGEPVTGAESERIEQQDLLAQCRMAYWTIWIAGFTGFGVVLLIGTLWEAFSATEAARLHYRASFPPKLRIRRVALESAQRPNPGDEVTGYVLLNNIGGGEAEFLAASCTAEWRNHTLPMRPPFEFDYPPEGNLRYGGQAEPFPTGRRQRIETGDHIKPGEWRGFKFSAPTRPVSGPQKLYICGWIDYLEPHGTKARHRTAFARFFDPQDPDKPWFQRYDQPDYEYED